MTYRRSKNSNREFFKIDGDLVLRVLNKYLYSQITVGKLTDDATDPYSTVESNEVEFNVAFEAAMQRIQTMIL